MPETLEARRMRGDDPVARGLLAMIEEEFTPDYGPPQPGSRFTVAPIPDYNGNPYATFWGEKAL